MDRLLLRQYLPFMALAFWRGVHYANDLPAVGPYSCFSLFYIVLTFFADLLNAWLDHGLG